MTVTRWRRPSHGDLQKLAATNAIPTMVGITITGHRVG
ncbi:hypothetical protein SAMN05421541_113271 [Actinoplanes philippinensis]|uniref:Uncharacterized protein n=1 Tax=Actinoplanes philippinensis TaxID=35752 RepID=A0A1I2JWS5_9ACTN|nr:hypothetical protein SAMN05421541_113271 [Actinoplanes philippinensis]